MGPAARFESAATALLTLSAIAVAVVAVGNATWAKPRPRLELLAAPTFSADWRSFDPAVVWVTDSTAPLRIYEVVDFECPVCGHFAREVLPSLLEKYAGRISVGYVHFPLPNHRFALPAARVAECASEQIGFAPIAKELFARQDSLGLKSWSSYAHDAGVRDTLRFLACTRETTPPAKVLSGLRLGREAEIRGTPTLFVGGWRVNGAVSLEEMAALVDSVSAGRAPAGASKQERPRG